MSDQNVKHVTDPTTGTFRWFEMTEPQYHDLANNYTGLCKACGQERDECEPDARDYPCESCGANEVYGTEELLMMNMIVLV